MESEEYMNERNYHTKVLIGVVMGMILVTSFLWGCLLGANARDRQEHQRHITLIHACQTVEDDAMRALCLVKL